MPASKGARTCYHCDRNLSAVRKIYRQPYVKLICRNNCVQEQNLGLSHPGPQFLGFLDKWHANVRQWDTTTLPDEQVRSAARYIPSCIRGDIHHLNMATCKDPVSEGMRIKRQLIRRGVAWCIGVQGLISERRMWMAAK